jgi:hypothetical protein
VGDVERLSDAQQFLCKFGSNAGHNGASSDPTTPLGIFGAHQMAAKGLAPTDLSPSGYFDALGQSFMRFLFWHWFLRFQDSGFLLYVKLGSVYPWIDNVKDKTTGILG